MAIDEATVKDLQSTQQQIVTLWIQQQQTAHDARQQQPKIMTKVTMYTPYLQLPYTQQPQRVIAPTMPFIPGKLQKKLTPMQVPLPHYHPQNTYVSHGGRGHG